MEVGEFGGVSGGVEGLGLAPKLLRGIGLEGCVAELTVDVLKDGEFCIGGGGC